MKIKRKNKKGISELLSYVLLITIALAMAGGVYAYLMFYAENPGLPEPECDVSVALVDYYCDQSWIYLTLENTGLHSVCVKVRLYDPQGRIISDGLYRTSGGVAIGVLDVEGNEKRGQITLEFDDRIVEMEILPFQIVSGEQKFCPEASFTVPIEGCVPSTTASTL
jgi:hypothetical protein